MTSPPSPEPPVTARQVVKRTVRLPTVHRFRLAWRLARNPQVPLRARLPLFALIVYLAMPLDIIPDFIPVLGQLDDLLIAGIAVWWFLRACPPALAMTEIVQLEAMPVGPVGRILPWLLVVGCTVLLILTGVWLFTR